VIASNCQLGETGVGAELRTVQPQDFPARARTGATHQDPRGAAVQRFADHEHLVHRELTRIDITTRHAGHSDTIARPRPADGRGARRNEASREIIPSQEIICEGGDKELRNGLMLDRGPAPHFFLAPSPRFASRWPQVHPTNYTPFHLH
jgi:hypothetical protein